MRFLAEPGEDRVARDPARIVSGSEGRSCGPPGLGMSHRGREQKASDIVCPGNRAHDREELRGKINARHKTSNVLRTSSSVLEESVSSSDRENQGRSVAQQALLPSASLVSSRARPGRTSKKEPKSSVVKASVTTTSQGLRMLVEEKPRDHVPGQSRTVSKSLARRGLVRKREPHKVEDEEFSIEDYLDKVPEGRNDGEYRKVWQTPFERDHRGSELLVLTSNRGNCHHRFQLSCVCVRFRRRGRMGGGE